MCAINPKHHIRATFDFYTAHPITAEDFHKKVLNKMLEAEQLINSDGSIRAHAGTVETINV